MKNRIEQALQELASLPLWSMGRACDIEWFQFGERRSVVNRNGSVRGIGTWALHVSCAWRIRDATKILVTSSDCYIRADHISPEDETFHWDSQGDNQRDQRTAAFMVGKEDSWTVTAIKVDEVGGFCLNLALGFYLEVFPDFSVEDREYWRLFQPSTGGPHFVVTASGIDD